MSKLPDQEMTPAQLLQRMFETGLHSDLTIRTEDKDFNVHQCIVYPKSPHLYSFCKDRSADAEKLIIEVEEDDWVVETILRQRYELEPKEPRLDGGYDDDGSFEMRFKVSLEICTATVKYQISSWHVPKTWTIDALRKIQSPELITLLSARLFDDHEPKDAYLRSNAAVITFDSIDRILTSAEAWKYLYGNERYVHAVFAEGHRATRQESGG